MRLLARRWVRVLAVVAIVLAASAPWWWGAAVFGVKLAVPGPSSRAADRRTSPPSGGAVPAPASTAPATTGDPAAGRTTRTTPPPPLRLQPVASLERPTSVADPRGPGPVLVSTQGGDIVAVDLATGTSSVLADLSSRITSGGERGLLSIALDPAGTRLYADYTDQRGDTAIVSWPFRSTPAPRLDLAGESVHLRIGQPFANHNGGNLVFGPDGALWIGTGDGGGAGDPNGNAQRTTTLLGKMLRVVPRPGGGVDGVAGNAYAKDGGRPEIWAIGLRNPWRYSFDRATAKLWIADVGQQSIEEISVVDPKEVDRAGAGANFGWNLLEGDNRYKGGARRGLTAPVHTYDHDGGACSVTGGFVYRGRAVTGLQGWYLFADYCAGWIRAIDAGDPEGRSHELISDAGSPLSFGELEDGELVVCTTEGLARLVRA